MTLIDDNQKIIPWYKERFVWMIIFFPLLAVIGGIITIILAIESNDGLVVDDYYKEGLEINRTLDRDHSAARHQLSAEIEFVSALDEVIIHLTANSDFHYPDQIEVSFLNATRAGMDQQVIMKQTEGQTYRSHLSPLAIGKWYVHIEHDDWRLMEPINIK